MTRQDQARGDDTIFSPAGQIFSTLDELPERDDDAADDDDEDSDEEEDDDDRAGVL